MKARESEDITSPGPRAACSRCGITAHRETGLGPYRSQPTLCVGHCLSELGRPAAVHVAGQDLGHDHLNREIRNGTRPRESLRHDLVDRERPAGGAQVVPTKGVDLWLDRLRGDTEDQVIQPDPVEAFEDVGDPFEFEGGGERVLDRHLHGVVRIGFEVPEGVQVVLVETVVHLVQEPEELRVHRIVPRTEAVDPGEPVVLAPLVLVALIQVVVEIGLEAFGGEPGVETEHPDGLEHRQILEELVAQIAVLRLDAGPHDQILRLDVSVDLEPDDGGAQDVVGELETDFGLTEILDLHGGSPLDGEAEEVIGDGEIEFDNHIVVRIEEHPLDGGEAGRQDRRAGDGGEATVQRELERKDLQVHGDSRNKG